MFLTFNATNNANLHGSKDELMKKLNYDTALEENKEEKQVTCGRTSSLYIFRCFIFLQ